MLNNRRLFYKFSKLLLSIMSKEIKKQHYYDISSFEGNFDGDHEPPYSDERKTPVKDKYFLSRLKL